jgi:uncharacterized protein
MANRLAQETSPYLLQHAGNPVDWYAWSPEALEAAKREDKPIFLSVGYSACHWCHVMAHESFEDPEVARLLNESFISIKVDREERPEVDQLYMEAVQMMTGRGGWPMSVFLTPELEPFFGGTYWPPEPRGGMAGFREVVAAVADAWQHRRSEAVGQAKQFTELLRETWPPGGAPSGGEAPGNEILIAAVAALSRSADPVFGGFGTAPKFPQPIGLGVLLRRWSRTGNDSLLGLVTTALDKMAGGGIYDHLGGGFHRYSVDVRWLVPHFEKMLYDNALLAGCYLEAWQATSRPDYARVVRETLDYVLRDMTDPAGGFYSSEDADSEGHEGRFYVWTPEEVASVLGLDAAKAFSYVYDVTSGGNFEGRSILNRPKTVAQCARILGREAGELEAELLQSRERLLQARARRVRPGRDDKTLASWNGLMIDTLARAGAALAEPRYLAAAGRAAEFILANMRQADGRLWHCWRQGRAAVDGLLEDYASLANACLTLYESQFDERWIDEAIRLVDQVLARFTDAEQGGFFAAPADHGSLIVRKKDMIDSSVPSGGGLATMALVRLGKLCGRSQYLAAAEAALRAFAPLMEKAPFGAGQMLAALDVYVGPTPEFAILGSPDQAANAEVLAAMHRLYMPRRVVAYRDHRVAGALVSPALAPLFEGKGPTGPGPTLFVCEDFACQAPVSGTEAAVATLASLASGTPT